MASPGGITRVFELKNGKLIQYEGNYTDYLQYKKSHIDQDNLTSTKDEITNKSATGKNLKEKKKLEAELRQSISAKRKVMEQKISEIEIKIEALEAEKQEIENQLSKPEVFKNENKAKNYNQRYQQILPQLPELYKNWEKIIIKLETLLSSIKN